MQQIVWLQKFPAACRGDPSPHYRFIWGASIEHIILGGCIEDRIFRIDDVSSVLSSQYDSESSCVFFMSRWFKRPLLFIFPGCYERNLREGSLKYPFWGDQRMHMYGKFVDFSLILHISLGLQWTDCAFLCVHLLMEFEKPKASKPPPCYSTRGYNPEEQD